MADEMVKSFSPSNNKMIYAEVTCNGPVSHPGGGRNTPSRFIQTLPNVHCSNTCKYNCKRLIIYLYV